MDPSPPSVLLGAPIGRCLLYGLLPDGAHVPPDGAFRVLVRADDWETELLAILVHACRVLQDTSINISALVETEMRLTLFWLII